MSLTKIEIIQRLEEMKIGIKMSNDLSWMKGYNKAAVEANQAIDNLINDLEKDV